MHIPVLLEEMLLYLSPKSGGVYIDATFGGGGYTQAILEKADCKVIAFDKDPEAITRGKPLKEKYKDRLTLVHDSFQNIANHIHDPIDGIVFDFGVSSFQLDDAYRGFSFQSDGPLDMRMSWEGMTAEDVVNTYKESDLADIIYHYGDERKSRAIARAIVLERKKNPITTTLKLATLIRTIVNKKEGIDPATKTFQALRIFVNNELIEIRDALENCLKVLHKNSVVVGVTFHSLEDKLLKLFLAKKCFNDCTKAICPTRNEVKSNPRSRSAKLRSGIFNDKEHG